MDWSRAKSVLILVFFILNIFLLINISILNPKDNISVETIKNTKKLLESRNIVLKCDIPVYRSEYVYLDYESKEFNRDKIIKTLLGKTGPEGEDLKPGTEIANGSKSLIFQNSNNFTYKDTNPDHNININNTVNIEKYIRGIMADMDIPAPKYEVDSLKKVSNGLLSVTFIENYRKFFLFDNKVEVLISEKGITEMKGSRIGSFAVGKRKILPAHQILIKNAVKLSNSTITRIDLGFKGQNPAWRVTLENGESLSFDAGSGDDMKTSG
jgi:hypothetical protein